MKNLLICLLLQGVYNDIFVNKPILVLDIFEVVVPNVLLAEPTKPWDSTARYFLLAMGSWAKLASQCINVHVHGTCNYRTTSFPLAPPMPVVSSNHGHERGNFELVRSCYLNYAYLHKDAIRLPLSHIPVGYNGSGFTYSLAVDALAFHQAVQTRIIAS